MNYQDAFVLINVCV